MAHQHIVTREEWLSFTQGAAMAGRSPDKEERKRRSDYFRAWCSATDRIIPEDAKEWINIYENGA